MILLSVLLWLASLVGAAIFLVAGVLIGRSLRRPVLINLAPEETSEEASEAGVRTADNTANSGAEAEANQRLLTAERELAAARTELAHSRAEVNRVGLELQRQRVETVSQTAAAAAARAELTRANEGTSAADRTRHDADRELERQAEKLRLLELRLEEVRLERSRLLEQQAALERQAAAVDPEVEKSLRLDLALVRERLQAQEDKAKRLDETNFTLREEVDELRTRAERLAALERENAELRVRALTSEPTPPPSPAGPASHALDVLVANVARLDAVRSAVVGDDLGLVVSCQGGHGDELAAIGALFSRACGEALKVLPLARIQRVAVEDDRQVTITMRPLRGGTDAVDDDQLTLVTLAHGKEPDGGEVARILRGESAAAVDAASPG